MIMCWETSPRQNKSIINELQLQRHGSKKEIWPKWRLVCSSVGTDRLCFFMMCWITKHIISSPSTREGDAFRFIIFLLAYMQTSLACERKRHFDAWHVAFAGGLSPLSSINTTEDITHARPSLCVLTSEQRKWPERSLDRNWLECHSF